MAVFHFAWDLEFFGYVPQGMTHETGWTLFARAIALSFLFLVGFSLFLAHGRGMRWRPYLRRLAEIAAGAALITLATRIATPESFIFFGILHHIVLASLLGLAFLAVPSGILLLLAAAAVAAPHVLRSTWFDLPALWWVGLSAHTPVSNDYVPLLPWFAATLAGIAAARIAAGSGLLDRLRPVQLPRAAAPVVFFGRHGLAFYLLHQPLLIAAIWLFAQVVPPEAPVERMVGACVAECLPVRDAGFCQAYCECVRDGLAAAGMLDAMLASRSDDADSFLRESAPIAAACLAGMETTPGGDR